MFKHRIKAFYILVFAVLVGYVSYASQFPGHWTGYKPFRLGLDLSGGSHLVYQADISKIDPSAVNDAMKSLRDVVERRDNTFGVSEPLVQVEQGTLSNKEAAYKLVVELPGVTDVNEASKSI